MTNQSTNIKVQCQSTSKQTNNFVQPSKLPTLVRNNSRILGIVTNTWHLTSLFFLWEALWQLYRQLLAIIYTKLLQTIRVSLLPTGRLDCISGSVPVFQSQFWPSKKLGHCLLLVFVGTSSVLPSAQPRLLYLLKSAK